jgi:hypothetical protein
MQTYRECISEVIKDSRLLYMDSYVPNSYIYHKIISKARSLIKRDSDTRRIFSQTHSFITINLFKLEANPSAAYGFDNFIHQNFYMRSVVPVPDCFTTYTGLALRVTTIQPSNKHFKEITASNYNNIMAREFHDPNEVYFWLEYEHLVFPEVHYRAVRLDGMFVNPLEVKKLNGTALPCERMLDQNFLAPDYLWDDIRNAVVIDILKEYVTAKPDEVPDMNENNKLQPQP